jgi:hypothetical protein
LEILPPADKTLYPEGVKYEYTQEGSLHSLNKIIKTLIYIVLINKELLLLAIFMPYLERAFLLSYFSPKKPFKL